MAYTAKADVILILEQGKLVEQGTHEELMKIENGQYRSMWEIAAATFKTQA